MSMREKISHRAHRGHRECGMKKTELPLKLLDTLQYVSDKSLFYQHLFSRHSINPDKILEYDDFLKIPLTNKSDLSEKGEEFIAEDILIKEWVTTSGTTSSPLKVPLTENDLKRLELNETLSLANAGITSSDTVLIAVAFDKLFIAGLAYYLGVTNIGAAALRVGASSKDMVINAIEQFKPTVIIGVPSFLLRVSKHAEAMGISLLDKGINKIIAIGEPVSSERFSRNSSGIKLEEAWGCKALSTYASTEMSTSFCECEFQKGGHYLNELLFLEVLDEEGKPVKDGELGEVVATPLGVEGLPVLRYATGDYAKFYRDRCECGYSFGRLGPIQGRKSGMLKIKGTTIFLSNVLDRLASLSYLTSYFVFITKDNNDVDALKVKVAYKESSELDKDSVLKMTKDTLKGALKVTPEILLSSNEEILELQSAKGSKKRFFQDLRSRD